MSRWRERVARVERVARIDANRFPRRKPKPMAESEAARVDRVLDGRADQACRSSGEELADAKGESAETDVAPADAPLRWRRRRTPEVALETKAVETPDGRTWRRRTPEAPTDVSR